MTCECDIDHSKDCEVTKIWYEWKDGNPQDRKIVAVDMKDTTGKEHTLITKELIIKKLEKGFPL